MSSNYSEHLQDVTSELVIFYVFSPREASPHHPAYYALPMNGEELNPRFERAVVENRGNERLVITKSPRTPVPSEF